MLTICIFLNFKQSIQPYIMFHIHFICLYNMKLKNICCNIKPKNICFELVSYFDGHSLKGKELLFLKLITFRSCHLYYKRGIERFKFSFFSSFVFYKIYTIL